jgi:aldehyde:ferredoxin oxidoreductase
MYGYHGRFLEVDLSAGTTTEIPLSEEVLEKYIGGATLAAALVYQRVSKDIDPLSPGNPLVFATGPFTGSSVPMVSRYAVCGISPLTGYWGESTSGGRFPVRLKGSGFDGLIVTGRSEKPVYLYLEKGKAEIRDASQLWGKDSYETQKLIKEELGDDNLSVACIASGGEKQIRYASIMNDKGRSAGRCGMGALMGSKNLKAVAAAGDSKPKMADPAKVRALVKQSGADIDGNVISVAFGEYGTLMYMDMGMMLGDVPVKYFTKSVFPVEKVTGEAFRQAYTIKNHACRGCPVGCGRLVKNFETDLDVDGPEYETAAAFGPLCLNNDIDSIVEANHLCNVHGIDTISAGVSIAYALYLYELGVLTKDEVGMELLWGDSKAILKLVEMIVNQEGIGEILSKGTLAMARHFGRDEGEAAQVKGLEMPMHDGRAFQGLAVSYATGPRGACHLKGDYYNVELGNMVLEYNILPGDRHSSDGKAEFAAKYQSLKDLFDALTLCKFAPLSPTRISEFLSAITGWTCTPESLMAAGDRSLNIKRAISSKLGLTREHDRLPEICMRPLDEGTSADLVPEMDKMLREYYAYRAWDWETGRPSKEKLLELGMNQVAEDLYA